MADIEKVIKALERCSSIDMCYMEISCYHPKYLECPYHEESECVKHLINDALELLKKQEPMRPTVHGTWTDGFSDYDRYCCRKCGQHLKMMFGPKEDIHWCPKCGNLVKWY